MEEGNLQILVYDSGSSSKSSRKYASLSNKVHFKHSETQILAHLSLIRQLQLIKIEAEQRKVKF